MPRTFSLVLLLGMTAGCAQVLGLSDFEDSPGSGGTSTGGGGNGGTPSGGMGGPGGMGGVGAGGSGGLGGGGAGGVPGACGDGSVDPGELCFEGGFDSIAAAGEDLRGFVLRDCNDDDSADIIGAYFVDGIQTLTNDGSGTFGGSVDGGSSDELVDIDIVELGAGAYEVASVSTISARTSYLAPAGGCQFTQTTSTAVVGQPVALTYVDANGNGNLDVAKVIHDNNGGNADIVINFDHGLGVDESVYGGGVTPGAIGAGDFDGDAGIDLLFVLPAQDTLYLIPNESGAYTGSFGTTVPTGGVGAGPVDLAIGDLDGDGDDDVVTANATANTIAVLRGLGAGGFSKQTPEPSVMGSNGVAASEPRAIVLADIDSDGDLDAVTANAGVMSGMSSISIFVNDGAGLLTLTPPIVTGPAPDSIRVADINGDGAPDIVAGTSTVSAGSSSFYIHLAAP